MKNDIGAPININNTNLSLSWCVELCLWRLMTWVILVSLLSLHHAIIITDWKEYEHISGKSVKYFKICSVGMQTKQLNMKVYIYIYIPYIYVCVWPYERNWFLKEVKYTWNIIRIHKTESSENAIYIHHISYSFVDYPVLCGQCRSQFSIKKRICHPVTLVFSNHNNTKQTAQKTPCSTVQSLRMYCLLERVCRAAAYKWLGTYCRAVANKWLVRSIQRAVA